MLKRDMARPRRECLMPRDSPEERYMLEPSRPRKTTGDHALHEHISGTAANIQHEMDDAIADRSLDV